MLKSVARVLPRAARAPAAPRDLARSFATSATSGMPDLKAAPHFRMSKTGPDAFLPHPIYTREEMNEVGISHVEPKTTADKAAFYFMKLLRSSFDLATGYGRNMTESKWLTRFLFLETVAGVPGMMGGMVRHLQSLRTMQRDRGWIHTLLEEAENERMHLMTFLELKKPGLAFRTMVLLGQGVFCNLYFMTYVVSPHTCHRFVGYLEEEAVKTYTKAIEALDKGELPAWKSLPASELAKKYWRLPADATFRDVLLAIRADEAIHREVNHTFSDLPLTARNPFEEDSIDKSSVRNDASKGHN